MHFLRYTLHGRCPISSQADSGAAARPAHVKQASCRSSIATESRRRVSSTPIPPNVKSAHTPRKGHVGLLVSRCMLSIHHQSSCSPGGINNILKARRQYRCPVRASPRAPPAPAHFHSPPFTPADQPLIVCQEPGPLHNIFTCLRTFCQVWGAASSKWGKRRARQAHPPPSLPQ